MNTADSVQVAKSVALAIVILWTASATAQSRSVHELPEHVACLKAATPECLFAIARDNLELGVRSPSRRLRTQVGMAQLKAGFHHQAIGTLRRIIKEMEASGRIRKPNPDFVDPYIALALAEHGAGFRLSADASFAEARANTVSGPEDRSRDAKTAGLLRLVIALADTGRLKSAGTALEQARTALRNAPPDPYGPNKPEAIRTLPRALASLAAAQIAASDFAGALATARQIGDAEHLKASGLSEPPRTQSRAYKASSEFLSGLAGISKTLSEIATVQLDRQDTTGARTALGKALAASAELRDPSYDLASALSASAPVQARLGDLDAAFTSAERIRELCCREPIRTSHNPRQYGETLLAILKVQLAEGDVTAASATAMRINRPREKALALAQVAAAMPDEDKAEARWLLSSAESLTHQVSPEDAKLEPWTQIASAWAQLGDETLAMRSFEAALEAARQRNIGDVIRLGDGTRESVGGPARFVASAMAEAGLFAKAVELAHSSCHAWTGAVRDVALIQLARGDLDGAEHTLFQCYRRGSEPITSPSGEEASTRPQSGKRVDRSPRPALDAKAVPALAGIAVLKAKKGDMDGAWETVEGALRSIAPLEWQRTRTRNSDDYARASWIRAMAEIAVAQAALGDASLADFSFSKATTGIRHLVRLEPRISAGIAVAQALARAQRQDESLAILLAARRDAVELMNNLRDGWVGANSTEARSALGSIAVQQAVLGDLPGALQTATAILNPSVLPAPQRYEQRLRLQRDAVLRDLALAMVEAGQVQAALALSEEVASSVQRAIVLAAIAGSPRAVGSALGKRSRRKLQREAQRLLEEDGSLMLADELTTNRVHGYTMLARSQAATGDVPGAKASLAAGHDLAKQVPDAADQISVLLTLAEAEYALVGPAAVSRTISQALRIADEGNNDSLRLAHYAQIARAQGRLLGRVAALETVRQIFRFYYTPVSASIRFPTTIAVLMRELRIPRFDTTPFPSR